ncbi:hypothetical protein [Pelagicoccus sp. SDUM812003]|uniref:hypothetical protein n=1 Tax=Pelagicoccus sp. SDUM812003 TaxID=3041267 RepID=UPI00280D0993|nr:hypothetical protein [Pelagicoccus sp. SDUM812003]MDQ8203464.1 hypothetical protein [Pelagicoccus sp. SDUM812003]
MLSLEQDLKHSARGFAPYLGALATAVAVFLSIGVMQSNIRVERQPETEPISEFHLPPPPPPPQKEPPPEQNTVSISFDLPVVDGPSSIPLGFLDVDFGLKPQELTQTEFDIDDSIGNYKTDGLDTLKIYSQNEVTEKPKRTYHKNLDIPARYLRGHRNKPITFMVLYTVTAEGRTANIHVLDCPIPEIVPFIERYIEGWYLEPAKKDGKPVNSWVQHKFTFGANTRDPFSP